MTAGTDATVEAGSPPLPVAATAAPAAPAAARRGLRRPTAWQVAAVIGVAVPLGVLLRIAMHGMLTFDGGMNFQVAWNMLHGGGYARDYGGHTVSPREIETSGPFLVIGALAVKVLGISSFGLLFTNWLFLGMLLVLTSIALRPWPVLRVVGPSAILLMSPQVWNLGFGGWGEFAVGALAIAALMLLATVVEGAPRPLRLCAAAFFLVGCALTIKVVAIAIVPPAFVGLVLVAVLRPEISRWRLAGTVLALPVPLIAWEAYRLTQLGSFDKWRAYWLDQGTAIGSQAGATGGTTDSGGFLHHGADHVHLLAVATGTTSFALVILLLAPVALLVTAFALRGCGWREWLVRPRRALAVLLLTYSSLYLVWWIFITPTSKAWLRRIVLAFTASGLASLLLIGFALSFVGARTQARSARRNRPLALLLAAAAVVLVVAVPAAAIAQGNARHLANPSFTSTSQVRTAASYARQLSAHGAMLCGWGWWSAPVVSLASHVPLCDLGTTDPCSAAMKRAFAAGDVYLVWDKYASTIVGPMPPFSQTKYAVVAKPSPYATFFRVQHTGTCP